MITELWHFFLCGGWVQCWALKNTGHACEIWVLKVHILWSPFLLLENRMMTFVFSATPFKVDMESNPKMDPWNRSVFVSFGLFSHCTAPQHEPVGSHFFWVPNMVILTKCPKRSWQTGYKYVNLWLFVIVSFELISPLTNVKSPFAKKTAEKKHRVGWHFCFQDFRTRSLAIWCASLWQGLVLQPFSPRIPSIRVDFF